MRITSQTKREIKLKDGAVIPIFTKVELEWKEESQVTFVTVDHPNFIGRKVKLLSRKAKDYFDLPAQFQVPGEVQVHKSLTFKKVERAIEQQQTSVENPGFCLNCGADCDGCEPDARNYFCENCGQSQVFGAEEIMTSFMHLLK